MTRYTIRQLEVFLEVAKDSNFAQAAERLGISQPAVSDHIRALERNLGAKLFARRRGMTVVSTLAGERLRDEARAILDRSARLSDRAALEPRTVCLRVFAGPHILDRMVRGALPDFYLANPRITLSFFSELSPYEVGSLIRRGDLDLAVFTTPASRLPADAQVLCEVPCVVVAARSLVGDDDLAPGRVSRVPFVLPLEGTPTASWVEQALNRLGIVPEQIIARTQFLDTQQRMVEAGDAAAVLFRECFESSLVRSRLRILGAEMTGMQRALVMRSGEQRPEVEAAAAFLKRAIGNPA